MHDNIDYYLYVYYNREKIDKVIFFSSNIIQ